MTRILVVDDEPQILRALQTSLRGAGYEVDAAAKRLEDELALGLGHAGTEVEHMQQEPAPGSLTAHVYR